MGAPGQAKSFAINQFRARITGARQFERLLTKQTDEDQLFGRVDLASLIPGGVSQAVLEQDLYYRELQAHLTGAMEQFRQQDGDTSAAEALQAAQEQLSSYTKALGQLHAGTPCVNTTDKIPEADIIMLDEIFKCNDGVLNSLLTALNERKYTNEGRTYSIPAVSFFAASNAGHRIFNDPQEKSWRPSIDRLDHEGGSTAVSPSGTTGWPCCGKAEWNGWKLLQTTITLDELKAMPDSIFNFDLIHLDYFKDLYFNFFHSVEVTNGLDISVGFSAHKRTAVERSRFVITGDYPMPPPEFMDKFKNTYISFCPSYPCGMDAGTLLLHERKA